MYENLIRTLFHNGQNMILQESDGTAYKYTAKGWLKFLTRCTVESVICRAWNLIL